MIYTDDIHLLRRERDSIIKLKIGVYLGYSEFRYINDLDFIVVVTNE